MIHHLPLCAINRDALPCDRSTLDPDALADLQTSIATTGLCQPIEVWRLSAPHQYGSKNDGAPPTNTA
jgi:ParB family chromosome partitioning protein